jgi:hypothetical protein
MKQKSRANAMSSSWDSVFEAVYDAYREAIEIAEQIKRTEKAKAA